MDRISVYLIIIVVVGFWSAPTSWHVSHPIKNARSRQQDMPTDHRPEHHSVVPRKLLLPRIPLPWELSYSNHLPSTTQSFPRSLLLGARHLQQPTFNSASMTLLSHWVGYAAKSSLHFKSCNNPYSSANGYRWQHESLLVIKSVIWAIMKNPNVQILLLWRFVISTPLVTTCRVFINWDLHKTNETQRIEP